MTQYDRDHVPDWLTRSLQSYAFLCGIKWIEERGERIHERVRQNDLKRFIKQHLSGRFTVREDPPYRLIAPSDFPSSLWRGDLAVRRRCGNKGNKAVYRTQFLFELKFADATPAAFNRDLYKLARMRHVKHQRDPDCRSFLVIVGRGAPEERFAYSGQPNTLRPVEMPSLRITHQTRGIYTATAIGREQRAHYVCLVEVTV
ncbi:hypothetical protein [Burkholderia multivorans]|uniref:hypothetical protein n=1 Tax=Burkholderia multivorans TaxID=87883 RepID=UPI0021C1F8D6|nr:hypothetical protein [Burkholderia multivorans]